MKVTVIGTYACTGGAGIAAYRLHKGFRLLKVESSVMAKSCACSGPAVYPVTYDSPKISREERIFELMQRRLVGENRSEMSNTLFSIPYPGFDISGTALIRQADIINLHWVAGFQSVESIASLLNSGKPVVWTLHDQHPFTGGCHYSAGCRNYRVDCRDCPQLKNDRFRFPAKVLGNKIKLWKNDITVVTPSKWLAQCAKESRLFRDSRIEVIPNSLETGTFKPSEKAGAKKKLGLEPHVVTLLCGAYSENEKRKGFSKLLEAVEYCLKDREFRNQAGNGSIKLITFGPPQVELEALDIETFSVGLIDDYETLAAIYSAADIFVLPSLEDNLPNTILEAMACGTPVVCFDVGGMPDIVKDGITGFRAPGFDGEYLGKLILRLISNEGERKKMNVNCRLAIEKNFKLEDQAGKYLQLFNELLERKPERTGVKKTAAEPALDAAGNGAVGQIGKIVLEKWNYSVQKELREVYKKSALQILAVPAARKITLPAVELRDLAAVNSRKIIEQKNKEINLLNKSLAQEKKRLINMEKNNVNHVKHIKQLNDILKQKNEDVALLNQGHRKKDALFSKQIRDKDSTIDDLNQELKLRNAVIQEISGSVFYIIGRTLTLPFRSIKNFFRGKRRGTQILEKSERETRRGDNS